MSEILQPFTMEALEQGYGPIVTARTEAPWIDNRLRKLKEVHEETSRHTFRVGYLTAELGRYSGLPEDRIAELIKASLMHDIGKLTVCRSILDKPGQLTPIEREQMKLHVTESSKEVTLFEPQLKPIIDTHHEFQDDPYPRAQYIPPDDPVLGFMQYLLALADGTDAIMSERIYKPTISPEETRQILSKRFAGDLVDFAVYTRAGIVT